jgi:glycosyltransferase involved in cell wall biosynthesis
MKILQVNKLYWPHIGGMEKVVQQLGEGLAARGHSCSVLVCGPKTSIEVQNGVTIHRLKTSFRLSSAPFSTAFPSAYHRLAQEHDVVIHHSPNPVGELADLMTHVRIPKIVLYQSDVVRQRFFKPVYDMGIRLFLKRARLVVATTPNYVNSSPMLGFFRSKLKIIPLSVDTCIYNPIGPIDPLLSQMKEQGLSIVLYIGRLAYYKGIDYLIRAAASLPQNAMVLLYGAGEEKTALQKLTQDLNLKEKVLFMDPPANEQLPNIYRGADVFVLPSIARTEAFGLVSLEAMASGIPVVTTELGTGTSYYNQNGITGLVIPPRDSKALAYAITQVLANPGRKEWGKAARARVEASFSQAVFLDNWEQLLLALS